MASTPDRARRRSRSGPRWPLLRPALRRRRGDGALDAVLDGRRLRIVFQPIIDLRDGRVVGVEALSRIPQESRRSPLPWFERARSSGRAAELDLLVFEAALLARGGLPPEIYLSVNVSPAGMLDRRIERLVAAADGALVVEITEHEIVDDYARLSAATDRYRRTGVRVAVDDAGAGWATLRHVLELRPEIIKLDRAVIARVATDPASRALVVALVGFGRDTGATILAEGVESDEQLEVLRSIGVDHAQGYALGRPGSLAAAIAARRPLPFRGHTPTTRWGVTPTHRLASGWDADGGVAVGRDGRRGNER